MSNFCDDHDGASSNGEEKVLPKPPLLTKLLNHSFNYTASADMTKHNILNQ
jgi:hypothetical protein